MLYLRKRAQGYGNNPEPVISDENARCCDDCNMNVVVPIRIIQMTYRSAIKPINEEESK